MLEVMPNLYSSLYLFDIGFNFLSGGYMKQILGTINKDIIDKWYLDEYKDKKIVFYLDIKAHC